MTQNAAGFVEQASRGRGYTEGINEETDLYDVDEL
jgi:hypothetical protein